MNLKGIKMVKLICVDDDVSPIDPIELLLLVKEFHLYAYSGICSGMWSKFL